MWFALWLACTKQSNIETTEPVSADGEQSKPLERTSRVVR